MTGDFHTSLLREKFILNDAETEINDSPPVVAVSNRIVLPLVSESGQERENFIVRAQNMHSCVRFAAAIAKEFLERGSIMPRITPFNWAALWKEVIKGYEREWNPGIWGAVYYNGKPVFQDGAHHPFLDIIEQCDARNKDGEYEESVAIAEDAFHQAGKAVRIIHDANVALVVKRGSEDARCGLILRGAGRTTTFSYTVTPGQRKGEMVGIPTLMTVSAAFLEAVQLAFTVGLLNKKNEYGLIEKYSDEYRKANKSTDRLTNLNTAISRFEMDYTVIYRPERPAFMKMVDDAESKAMKILKPMLDAKRGGNDPDGDQWVL